jgi:hypothetical protein
MKGGQDVEQQKAVARLRSLREEIERDGEVRTAALETTFALALSDVCCALGFTEEEHDEVLGRDAAAYVAEIRQVRFWPIDREMEEETATVALTGAAAVPA